MSQTERKKLSSIHAGEIHQVKWPSKMLYLVLDVGDGDRFLALTLDNFIGEWLCAIKPAATRTRFLEKHIASWDLNSLLYTLEQSLDATYPGDYSDQEREKYLRKMERHFLNPQRKLKNRRKHWG